MRHRRIATDLLAVQPSDWRAEHSSPKPAPLHDWKPFLGVDLCTQCHQTRRWTGTGMWIVTDGHGEHRRYTIGPCGGKE